MTLVKGFQTPEERVRGEEGRARVSEGGRGWWGGGGLARNE